MALAHAASSSFAGDPVGPATLSAGRRSAPCRPGNVEGDARAFWLTGFAALVSLPLLIAISVVLKAPLAAPSAIALGYFGAAAALSAGDRNRADTWSAGVFAALVAWTALSVLAASRGAGGMPTISALLAPLFAAAPLLASLGKAPAAGAAHVDARERPAGNDAPSEARFDSERSHPVAAAGLLRRLQKPAGARAATMKAPGAKRSIPVAPPSTDLVAAIRFAAASHARGKSDETAVQLNMPQSALVRCDERGARKIAAAALELSICADPSLVDILVRPVKGAVLLRLISVAQGEAARRRPEELRRLQALADAAGGSAIALDRGGRAEISIRLAPAAPSPDGAGGSQAECRVAVGAGDAHA